ncbi:MAG TPA: CoA transferase [Rhizomicrobium sp.]|jgi:crotonobetainyl-CoA:carnitine CoA-transferase CaiB-like acyl-CoA transferase|nr:CoA transferase [Rhizomicrobium sp.]
MTVRETFEALNRIAGIAPLKAPVFTGDDPIMATPFRAGTAAASALGLGAAAANEIWRLRGGAQQEISVDLRAAAASLVSFSLLRLNGEAMPRPSEGKPTVALYPTMDGRWIHLHGGFPHLETRTLDLLNAANTHEAVAASVAKWNAAALEESLAFMGQCGAVVRTEEEWRASPQGKALANTPPITLKRIGDAPPLRPPESKAPLDGIRVLDLTRVLAGPSAGRTLASYGADVLTVRAPALPTVELFDIDTGFGKRAAFLDLKKSSDAEQLRALVRQAHVFADSYRPGALANLGFTPAALAHAAPGIVYLSVSCYGAHGPWAQRRGWEQLAQSATGMAVEQGAFAAMRAGKRRESVPQLVPAAMCDYVTGYLAAAGVAAALLKRIREGGSWLVEVSLCATAMWIQSLGKLGLEGQPEQWQPRAGLDAYFQSCETERGRLDYLGPVVRMQNTPPAWRNPPSEAGQNEPRWLG